MNDTKQRNTTEKVSGQIRLAEAICEATHPGQQPERVPAEAAGGDPRYLAGACFACSRTAVRLLPFAAGIWIEGYNAASSNYYAGPCAPDLVADENPFDPRSWDAEVTP